MHGNTPVAVDRFADLIDPALTDMAAPVVFVAIALLVWWRWGRYPAVLLGLAGACTGLTRLGDLVNRPRPTSTVEKAGAGAVWLGQNILLGSREDMNDVADAIGKIHTAFRADATPVN